MGRFDVDQVMAEMDPDLIHEWQAYHRHIPTPMELWLARICALIANGFGDGKNPKDELYFLPPAKKLRVDPVEMTEDEMKSVMLSMFKVPDGPRRGRKL